MKCKTALFFMFFFGFSLFLSSEELDYKKLGNDLNRKETTFANFYERSKIAERILKVLSDHPEIKKNHNLWSYIERTNRAIFNEKMLKISNKNECFFNYFDLVLFNLIDFSHKVNQGMDFSIMALQFSPRLTQRFLSTLAEKTNKSNYLIRRFFLTDFYLSDLSRQLSASEKLRFRIYLKNKSNKGNKRPREVFHNTDLLLRMIRPYFRFQENDFLQNLFTFNMEAQDQIDKVKAVKPGEDSSNKTYAIKNVLEKPLFWPFVGLVLLTVGILLGVLLLVTEKRAANVRLGTNKTNIKRNIKTHESSKTPFDDQSVIETKDVKLSQLDPVSQMMIASLPKRYENIWKISKGGMGIVFGATDKFLRRNVAIKMISPSLCDDQTIVHRFINEARSVAGLDHPNILKIFDVGGDSYPYFVMEFLEGISLEELVQKKKKLTNAEMKYYGIQMADAFLYCHNKGIIHRDIKPANILIVNGFRQVKIVDFGIAKDHSLTNTGLTQANISVGSPLYMAPEQIKGNQYGVSSDIYSFGLTLYKMASGVLPFGGTDILARVSNKPEDIRSICLDINPLIASLIMKCIETAPEKRFDRFEQVKTVLLKVKV